MEKKNYNKILIIALIIIIIILLLNTCKGMLENERMAKQISEYKVMEKEFAIKMKKDSSTLATQSQTILTQKEAIEMGLLKLDDAIKKAQSQVSQTQKVVIQKVDVPYVPNNYVDTSGWYKKLKSGYIDKAVLDSIDSNCIVKHTKFLTSGKWFKIKGSVEKEGIAIDSIDIENKSTVTIGYKRSGFLGLGKKPIVEIKNTNPYLSVSNMNNVVIKKKRTIFSSKGFWGGLGLLSGIILSKY